LFRFKRFFFSQQQQPYMTVQNFVLISYLKSFMQNKELPALERKLMLIGILLFLVAWYAGSEEYKQISIPQMMKDLGFMLAMAVLQWIIARRVMAIMRKKFPNYSQTLKRILFTVFTSGILGMISTTLLYGIPQLIFEHRIFGFGNFMHNFGPCFFFSALIIGAHEVMFNFYELNRISKEREELKKAHLQSQLDSLKTQVSPHFLFNSLNTALSLIRTSPDKAEKFLLELSSVYRYLLQTSENQMTSLQQELQFTHSYFHLLKTRFGDAIQLEIDVDDESLHYQLPSLTLQLLLENAVKHNVVSMSKPLTISLRTDKQSKDEAVFLTVQNNLQRKTQAVPSHKMGLNNILSKFRLLNHEEVIVTDKDNHFTVILPLLKKQPV
jgi:sensor histidine kinase YesM